jgi:hypothetical protein
MTIWLALWLWLAPGVPQAVTLRQLPTLDAARYEVRWNAASSLLPISGYHVRLVSRTEVCSPFPADCSTAYQWDQIPPVLVDTVAVAYSVTEALKVVVRACDTVPVCGNWITATGFYVQPPINLHPVPTLTIVPQAVGLPVGSMVALWTVATDTLGQVIWPPVTWSHSNAAVATVGAGGGVTAQGNGQDTVYAQVGSLTASAIIIVGPHP